MLSVVEAPAPLVMVFITRVERTRNFPAAFWGLGADDCAFFLKGGAAPSSTLQHCLCFIQSLGKDTFNADAAADAMGTAPSLATSVEVLSIYLLPVRGWEAVVGSHCMVLCQQGWAPHLIELCSAYRCEGKEESKRMGLEQEACLGCAATVRRKTSQ